MKIVRGREQMETIKEMVEKVGKVGEEIASQIKRANNLKEKESIIEEARRWSFQC